MSSLPLGFAISEILSVGALKQLRGQFAVVDEVDLVAEVGVALGRTRSGRHPGANQETAIDAVFFGTNPLAVELVRLEGAKVDWDDVLHVQSLFLEPAGCGCDGRGGEGCGYAGTGAEADFSRFLGWSGGGFKPQ